MFFLLLAAAAASPEALFREFEAHFGRVYASAEERALAWPLVPSAEALGLCTAEAQWAFRRRSKRHANMCSLRPKCSGCCTGGLQTCLKACRVPRQRIL